MNDPWDMWLLRLPWMVPAWKRWLKRFPWITHEKFTQEKSLSVGPKLNHAWQLSYFWLCFYWPSASTLFTIQDCTRHKQTGTWGRRTLHPTHYLSPSPFSSLLLPGSVARATARDAPSPGHSQEAQVWTVVEVASGISLHGINGTDKYQIFSS